MENEERENIKAIAERIWMIENSPLYANKERELEQLTSNLSLSDIFEIDDYIMTNFNKK